ncbi:DUF4180 domain-containing protein [Chryseolinea sp. H1M3-3]|uniref:DUF4180 domain-containing protein n=1 Tax=Chryseolinea sp. H1M3-3 TaxID=3034144 RepID=UPI0023EDE625|nr:DUF4180 domain-containing protein [Chryseolinea sp. H1M3-3]
MKYIQHHINGQSIAELSAEGVMLSTAQQFLQMIMDSSAEGIIVHQESIDQKFFDLRSGLAGEMLQKVVNYRLRLAIVGDFSIYESKSLKAFISENNRSNAIVFVNTIEDALVRLSK